MEAKCDLKWYLWDRTVDAWNKRVWIADDNVGIFSSLLTHGINRAVWRPYSAVSFSTNRYQRRHMTSSWSWEKGCILWVRDVFFIFPSAVLYFVMQCMSSFTFPTRKLCACSFVFICVYHSSGFQIVLSVIQEIMKSLLILFIQAVVILYTR